MTIRRATPTDVPALLTLKHQLRFDGESRGGFLLGSDEQGYQRLVQNRQVWILELKAEVVGFATTMRAAEFVNTPLWELRHQVKWLGAPHAVLSQGVGYYDQLAVRRGTSARAAALLAFTALWDIFNTDRYVVTTTVVAPVRNAAAVPLIQSVGGIPVGEVEEEYDNFGRLTSCVWLICAEETNQRLSSTSAATQYNVLSAVARAAQRDGVTRIPQPLER